MIALGALGLVALTPTAAMARTVETWRQNANRWAKPKVVFERALSFRHRHTGENLDRRVYYADGRYLPDALKEINHLLRDFRNDEVRPIDPGLLDLLYALQLRTESQYPFEIYSGYRSPETNAQLRRVGVGVARNSLHMQGKAIDIALPGVESNDLFRAAWSLQRGGVGFYGGSTFVHVDVGEVRTWRG
jgi:uncharacterized protein YcbK (DUF882 family)